MKIIKNILPVMLVAMVACSKSNTDTFVPPYITQADVVATIASSSDVEKYWCPGDSFSLFSEEDGRPVKYSSVLMSDDKVAAKSGFNGDLFSNASGEYYALFPHRDFNSSADYKARVLKFRTEQIQTISAESDKTANGLMPFVAHSKTLSDLSFEPIFGLFQVKVAGRCVVKSVSVASPSGDKLWGDITYNVEKKSVAVDNDDPNANVINIYCGEYGIELKDTPIQYFTFAVPPTISSGLVVTLNMVDGETLSLTPTKVDDDNSGNVVIAQKFEYPLTYVYDNKEIKPVNISSINEETTKNNTWVVKLLDEPDVDETLDAETFSQLLEKIRTMATTSSVTILMPDVTVIAAGSASIPVAIQDSACDVLLSFPRAYKVEEYAFGICEGLLKELSLLVPQDIDFDENAFGGFTTSNCALVVDNNFYRSLDVPYWREHEWLSINRERVYSVGEFDKNSGLLGDGSMPVGSTWVIDIDDATGVLDADVQQSTLGLKSALKSASSPVTLKIVGKFANASDGASKNAFAEMSNIKAVDLTDDDMTTIPEGFLKGSSLESVTFNRNIEEVGSAAFKQCKSLVSINYGEGERTAENSGAVKYEAFCDVTLLGEDGQTIDMSWVESVAGRAFAGCENIQHLNLSAVNTLDKSIFISVNKIKTLDLSAEGDFNFTGEDNEDGKGVFISNEGYQTCELKLNRDKLDGSAYPQANIGSGYSIWLKFPGSQSGTSDMYWSSIIFDHTHDATGGSGHDGMGFDK